MMTWRKRSSFAATSRRQVYIQVIEHVGTVIVATESIDRSRNALVYSVYGSSTSDSIEEITIHPDVDASTLFNVNPYGGDDSIIGGHRVFGGEGNVYLADAKYLNGGPGNDDLVAGKRTIQMIGGIGDDFMDGRKALDSIQACGGDGDDHIFGGRKGDHIDGGSGNDDIFGKGGADVIHADFFIRTERAMVTETTSWRVAPDRTLFSDMAAVTFSMAVTKTT